MSQIGARSNMLGGAMVGSVRDNSAIFYNPAGLAFVDNSSLSVMGDAYYMDMVKYKNGAGDGVDLYSSSLQANPQLFAGIYKSRKKPWLTINYAIINRGISETNLFAKETGTTDVFSDVPGDEDFYSSLEVKNKTREDWAGVGYGYKINDRLGIGFSIFAAFYNQSQFETADINIIKGENENANTIGLQQTYNNLTYSNVSLLGKFGISYEFDKFNFGGTITLPRFPLSYFSYTTINRHNTYFIPSISQNTGKVAYSQYEISNQHKSPLSIDFGCKFRLNSRNLLYFTTAYFGSIDRYNILTFTEDLSHIDSLLFPNNANYSSVYMANRAVMNFALGYEYIVKESLTMLLGFRTDFNNVDFDKVDYPVDYTPTFCNWDIYHLSGGVDWRDEKFNLSLGLNTSYGQSRNQDQFVNLSTPSEDNKLFGDINNTVSATYLRLTLLIGFTFYFQQQYN